MSYKRDFYIQSLREIVELFMIASLSCSVVDDGKIHLRKSTIQSLREHSFASFSSTCMYVCKMLMICIIKLYIYTISYKVCPFDRSTKLHITVIRVRVERLLSYRSIKRWNLYSRLIVNYLTKDFFLLHLIIDKYYFQHF